MSAVTQIKIDQQSRAHLRKLAKPGEMYQAENPEPGVIILRKLEPKPFPGPGARKMTSAEVKKALRKLTVRSLVDWEEIRKETREL